MKRLILTCALIALATPAAAQIQPGPNIAPNGLRFTFSPRFGYLGPPVGFVFYPPPVQRYGYGAMPMIVVPRDYPDTGSPGASPVRPIERGAPQAQARPPAAPAPRLPGKLPGRQHIPNVPCPDGCAREPDDPTPVPQ